MSRVYADGCRRVPAAAGQDSARLSARRVQSRPRAGRAGRAGRSGKPVDHCPRAASNARWAGPAPRSQTACRCPRCLVQPPHGVWPPAPSAGSRRCAGLTRQHRLAARHKVWRQCPRCGIGHRCRRRRRRFRAAKPSKPRRRGCPRRSASQSAHQRQPRQPRPAHPPRRRRPRRQRRPSRRIVGGGACADPRTALTI